MRLDRWELAPNALAIWAKRTPDGVAVQQVGGGSMTFAALHDTTLRWVTAAQRAGIAPGDHVGTFLPNGLPTQIAMLALGTLGAVEVPVNAAHVGSMLEHTLRQADVRTLVTTTDRAVRLRDIVEPFDVLETIILTDDGDPGPLPHRVLRLSTLLDGAEPARDLPGPEPHDIAALLFTSGTTGPSKAVIAPWALITLFWSFLPAAALTAGSGFFCSLPTFHNSGRSGFNLAVARGARFVFRERFSASTFWDDVRANECRVAALVGPLTGLLWQASARDDDPDNPLETVVIGPMIPEIEDFERRFRVHAITCYGQTEVGCPIVTTGHHGPWENCGRERAGYPGVDVRIVDDQDYPVGPGVVGELVVRTSAPWSVNRGYYKMPAETATAWRGGWFHTGDALRYDEEGRFYFVDRMSDTIRRRGENISSFEIETVVAEHPDVVECAAFGIATPLGDDEVMIAVRVRDGGEVTPASLIDFAESRLPRFMLPRYVEVVDDLPRNTTSHRVQKSALRERGVTPGTWDRSAPA